MTRQIVLREPVVMVDRRQPLLNTDYSSGGGVRKVRLAEVAGGTAAECAAVCCCCPCGLIKFLILAVYILPAGLCRKALRMKRWRRLLKKGQQPPRKCGCDNMEFEIQSVAGPVAIVNAFEMESNDKEVIELEKEMWGKFYDAGFWRNPSQRNDIFTAQ